MPLDALMQKQEPSVVYPPPDRAEETHESHNRKYNDGDALADDVPLRLDVFPRDCVVIIRHAAVVDVFGAACDVEVFPAKFPLFRNNWFREYLLVHQRNERRPTQTVAVKKPHASIVKLQSQRSGVQRACRSNFKGLFCLSHRPYLSVCELRQPESAHCERPQQQLHNICKCGFHYTTKGAWRKFTRQPLSGSVL